MRECDLTVQGGLGLKQRKKNFGQTFQGIGASVRKSRLEIRSERVSVKQGGLSGGHRF